MRFLATGDWHYTNKRPVCRKDPDYQETCLGKIRQVLDIAKEEDCQFILQPGDLVDTARLGLGAMTELVGLLRARAVPVYCVMGQHDMWFHKPDPTGTPMGLLDRADAVTFLSPGWENLKIGPGNLHIQGVSWGQKIPECTEGKFNILVIHKMIIHREKLWEGQEDYVEASKLLRDSGYDLVVSGDNHRAFHHAVRGRALLNCGSLLRSSVDQVDHQPHVYICEVDEQGRLDFHRRDLQVEDAGAVMDFEQHEATKERNEALDAFVEGLDMDFSAEMDFRRNLTTAMKVNKVEKPVADAIEEIMEGK